MSRKINSAEEALKALKDALDESESWKQKQPVHDWEEAPDEEWDSVSDEDLIHDVPKDFYNSHYNDYENPYDDYEEQVFSRQLPKHSHQSDWEVYEDGDFNFVEPKYQQPKHSNDHINRRGRLYNEHIPNDVTLIMYLFNVANQRYVNDYLTNGIQELVMRTVDDDPYQAAFIMYSFSMLLTTAKDDDVRSHLFAAIEMLWDAYTNACYGYKFEKYGTETFLSAMEYNMFYIALNYLNFLHHYLYPLEKGSGRLYNSPYAVSKFTSKFLDRDDVKIHVFRIQPDFDTKTLDNNYPKQKQSNQSNNRNQYKNQNENQKRRNKNKRHNKKRNNNYHNKPN